VLALYIYGGGSLRGMAESQMIGIVIGTLSSIFVACPLLLWLGVSKQDLLPKARDEPPWRVVPDGGASEARKKPRIARLFSFRAGSDQNASAYPEFTIAFCSARSP
jgi:hypothetical protein